MVMTANIREWRHFLTLRTSPFAHPQMRQVTIPLLRELKEKIPIVFDDIEIPD
jgi:thymidylate synthase (FAD)